ncbi:MAG: ATP:cob(I)alamin adenosyltransferase, partial [Cyanobacteria bacterium NC_groundwater_1444_Ag_S-0.65um_54_12]|nr:ATP:cob(I)alamin adenosyltransferase [Cyanobacteria bacterium NC_groundwater_1444_Ag_S-0.65um_54_12]
LHVARTVARRAERLVVSLQAAERLDLGILEYLNRLSDYLFVLARYVNQQLGTPDWPAADDSLPPVVK